MLNNCFTQKKIPTIWRKSKMIAILKPGKGSAIPINYRPISFLCHTYNLYERLILNRIASTIEEHLIKEQVGFRPGKSCTIQLLNLTQHIEDKRVYVELNNERSRWKNKIMACHEVAYSHQPYSSSIPTTSRSMMDTGASSTQTIYVSKPNFNHSRKWKNN